MTKRHRSGDKRGCVSSAVVAFVLIGGLCSDATTAVPPRDLDSVGGPASTHIVARLDAAFAHTVRSAADDRGVLRGTRAQRMMSTALRRCCVEWRMTAMQPAYPFAFKNPKLAAKHGLDRYYVIQVPPGTDTPAMAESFGAHRREIEFVATDTIGGIAAFIPDDEDFVQQWNMHNAGQSGGTEDADVDAPEAWDLHTGLTGDVTIAIIDSGVSPHVDFGDRLLAGINTDPFSPDNLTVDDCGHGTHVAGIAAATGNNGIGVAGMTWGAKIMPVRVLQRIPNACSGFSSALANGIIWAAENGADVANISLQFYNLSAASAQNLQDAVNFAHDLGVVLVAATGNNDGGSCNCPGFVAYPARLDNVTAVAWTDDDDSISFQSNWGLEVDVSAPGSGIYSTFTGDGYLPISGTSMATPHVAGLAALMKSHISELTSVGITQIIMDTVDDLGPEGWDIDFGLGRINAHQAMIAAEGWLRIISSLPPEGSIDARAPHELDDPLALLGWQWIYLTFPGPVSGLLPEDFVVSQEGGVAGTPVVASVEQLAADRVKVTFDERLEAGSWTTVTHVDSQTSVRVGSLPGDVNGDGTSTADDVAAMMDSLSGVGDPRELWSVDIDHTFSAHPADLLRLIDVLNGASAFEPYLDVSLP